MCIYACIYVLYIYKVLYFFIYYFTFTFNLRPKMSNVNFFTFAAAIKMVLGPTKVLKVNNENEPFLWNCNW